MRSKIRQTATMFGCLAVAWAAILMAGEGVSQENATRETGPAIGSIAPEFELPSAGGGAVRLSELRAERPVAILFYRSADW